MPTIVESRDLKMHNNLLMDVIKRQAGTLDKAILEGVMNSVEAGASRVDIEFKGEEGKQAYLSISDDGKGITTKEELIHHFETFGTPHEDNENKYWAQFRMGRGQLFAFGKNTWRTSHFKMTVDIENNGLSYDLSIMDDYFDGCRIDIELYENPLDSWQFRSEKRLKESIKSQIEFIGCPVYFNEELITCDPSKLNWDKEDDYAYYLFHKGDSLKIYNLGAFTKSVPIQKAGTSGIIVSKRQLKVNFARNDIQSDCPVYEEIEKVIVANRAVKAQKKYTLMTEDERMAILRDIRDGIHPFEEIKSSRVLKTTQGKWYSLNMFADNNQHWTFGYDGCRKCDQATEQNLALCLSDSIVDILGFDGEKENFFEWLLQNYISSSSFYRHQSLIKRIVDRSVFYIGYNTKSGTSKRSLSDSFNSSYITLPVNKLTASEKRIVRSLNKYYWEGRTIGFGSCDEANAWTDGNSYIILERNFVRNLHISTQDGCAKLFALIIHELAHDDNTDGSHIHGVEFYERYHELCMGNRENPSALTGILNFHAAMERCKIDDQIAKDRKKIEEKKEKERKTREKLGLS
jgi:hypothetical protein